MGIVGIAGTVVSGIKTVQVVGAVFWRSLNPWVFFFCLFSLMLIALGVNEWLEKLEKRFTATNNLIETLKKMIQEKENEVGALRNEVARATQAAIVATKKPA